jgi:hypothetical protein
MAATATGTATAPTEGTVKGTCLSGYALLQGLYIDSW